MKVQEANGRQCAKISYNSTQTDLLKSNLKKTRGLCQHSAESAITGPRKRSFRCLSVPNFACMSGKPKFSPWSSLLAPYLLIHEGKIIHSSFGGLAKFDELSSHEPLISFSKSRSTMEPSRICIEGKNCCAITRANRVALLVDGDVYFTTLALALERAQRFILIAGWQLDSRLRLNPRDPESPCFGDFLHALVRRNRKLRI
jgi:hypothetical protein